MTYFNICDIVPNLRLILENVKAVKIAILDGVLYIKGKNKMYKDITEKYKNENIMSALVLREFLYQV